MKNSPRHNPTKDIAAPSKQAQQRPANRAGTFTDSQATPHLDHISRDTKQRTAASEPGIRSSRPLVAKQVNDVPLRAAQGDDDIMSQEKAL